MDVYHQLVARRIIHFHMHISTSAFYGDYAAIRFCLGLKLPVNKILFILLPLLRGIDVGRRLLNPFRMNSKRKNDLW